MPPLKGSGSTSASLPSPRSVLTHIRDQLPSLNSNHTKDYFDAPMFGFALLYDASKLYKCTNNSTEKLEFLDISDLKAPRSAIQQSLD